MKMMKLNRRVTLMCYGPTGSSRAETLDAGEMALPVGDAKDGIQKAMTMAGFAHIPTEYLSPDSAAPTPERKGE